MNIEEYKENMKSYLQTRKRYKINKITFKNYEEEKLILIFSLDDWIEGEITNEDIEDIMDLHLSEGWNNDLAGYKLDVDYREKIVKAEITDSFS